MSKNQRINTPAEQQKEDTTLIEFRLRLVEEAVKDVGVKVERLDSPKKSDLLEFRDTILARINEIRDSLNKKIDDNETDMKAALALKADKSQVDDLRTLVKAAAAFLTTVMASLLVYFITKLS